MNFSMISDGGTAFQLLQMSMVCLWDCAHGKLALAIHVLLS